LYRANQMLTDFQKSVDRLVSLSPTALCLSEAKDLPPSPSTKSGHRPFLRRRRCPQAIAAGEVVRDAPGRMYPSPCSPAEYLSVVWSVIDPIGSDCCFQ
jgi:hypothetical protein